MPAYFKKEIHISKLKIRTLPSRKSGRNPSMSISGTLSKTVIQPTKNCRTKGLTTVIRSCRSGINSSILEEITLISINIATFTNRFVVTCN